MAFELAAENEEAKRFDILPLLNLQLAQRNAEPTYPRLCEQVRGIAGLLEEKASIPAVREHPALIQAVMTEEWWQDVTVPMLETVRRNLRALVELLDKRQRKVVYTDFDDEMGVETAITLPGFTTPDSFARFHARARHFRRRMMTARQCASCAGTSRSLRPTGNSELERLLLENGVGTPDDLRRAAESSHGLGLFVQPARSGPRRRSPRLRTLLPPAHDQSQLLNLIIEHLSEHGIMDRALLDESPYTDINPLGVEGVFAGTDIDELFAILAEIGARAVGIGVKVSNGFYK